MAGSNIAVSGAIFTDRLMTERLTDYIYLLPCRTLTPKSALDTAVRRVAHWCRAFKNAIEALDDFYRTLVRSLVPPPSHDHFIGPHLTSLTIGGKPATLTYDSLLDPDNIPQSVFHATLHIEDQKGRAVVVKFTAQYCEEMHSLLAALDPPRAPALHFCERIASVGGLVVVVMDYTPSVPDMQWTAAHAAALREAVAVLHARGYVHGDLRAPNVLPTDDENLVVIDFDWGGLEGDATYPSSIFLDTRIGWHPDVKRGGVIRREHDVHFVERLCS